MLAAAKSASTQALSDGSWRVEFAGKEIFRDVGSHICDRTILPKRRLSSAEFDADLAKEVGYWQRENGPPPDLHDLLVALRARVADSSQGQ
jgi:hypothetical protein